MFLRPTDLETIKRGHAELIDGADGTDIVMHWLTVSGPKDAYGKYASEVDTTLAIRALVVPVSNILAFVRGVQKAGLADMQNADHILYLKPDVDLSNKEGLWFDMPDLGKLLPECINPVASHVQGLLYPNGKRIVQEIYCRLKR